MYQHIETVRKLWRGDTVTFPGATGAPVAVRTLPRPVQSELPIWVTSAGSTETYEAAGRIGANLLTHLLGQTVDELADRIAAYRRSWEQHGQDRKSVVEGKSVDLGGRRIIKKKKRRQKDDTQE